MIQAFVLSFFLYAGFGVSEAHLSTTGGMVSVVQHHPGMIGFYSKYIATICARHTTVQGAL